MHEITYSTLFFISRSRKIMNWLQTTHIKYPVKRLFSVQSRNKSSMHKTFDAKV